MEHSESSCFRTNGVPEKHKDVILTMWREWQRETPRHLASYMLEREISNLWGYVVRTTNLHACAGRSTEKHES